MTDIPVLFFGSRGWLDGSIIKADLIACREEFGDRLLVVSGGAAGADAIADALALQLGIDRIICPANWIGRGKYAGPHRNSRMSGMNLVRAYRYRCAGISPGTDDMARKLGLISVPLIQRGFVPQSC